MALRSEQRFDPVPDHSGFYAAASRLGDRSGADDAHAERAAHEADLP
jgi:hypothetical protein